MSIQSALAAGRRAAESRMLDTWAIGADLGWSYDAEQDKEVQSVSPLFTTPGRLKVSGNVILNSEAGNRSVVESRRELHIPVGSPPVPANAVAQCVAVHETSDPTMLGAIVRISGATPGSQTTARRLEVTEVLT